MGSAKGGAVTLPPLSPPLLGGEGTLVVLEAVTHPSSSRTSAQVLLSLEHSIHVYSEESETSIRVLTVSPMWGPVVLPDPEDALSASTLSLSEASTCRAINPCFFPAMSDIFWERTLSFAISDSIRFLQSVLWPTVLLSSPRRSASHFGHPSGQPRLLSLSWVMRTLLGTGSALWDGCVSSMGTGGLISEP